MSTAATTSSRLVMPTKPKSLPRGHRRPGTLPAYGPALRAPVGPIHWASTETSTFWNGYMDGAVRSGGRAAAEVLARL